MFRTGIGFDSHRLCEGRRLIIGGVEISFKKGLIGHSDADVLCHALCDALLGAVADGNIGTHFSDKDPQWKDADSVMLLQEVVKRLNKNGWSVSNTDATIIVEQPRMAPYIDQMREILARAMGIAVDAVSIKAKTNEGMGFEGRGEGISAMAVATVEKDNDKS
ncbi:MAG: 2-C-methyl-D-erythritol 2,4-cyclodiphosphate synthase [Kiritimatiellae bacterium]|jgi:2-C-methyl-D-erythritol 2,4-cyclodiphosphate synthase|nr:2-C-methyl-D-erythritol 2,4-cyclodiphosphate synthase [Kiritimatiellia bacterium]